MTTRVIDCRRPTELRRLREPRRTPKSAARRATSIAVALLTAIVLVPLASAGQPPSVLVATALAALAILLVGAAAGPRIRWGWLAALFGGAALIVPRGPADSVRAVLLVACALSAVFWLSNRRRFRLQGPPVGAREYQLQQLTGLSGELQVGERLARELPQEFVLVNGLKLPRGAGDIDHLVVGPSGVFLLETKMMSGKIVCTPDGTWHRTKVGRGGTPYTGFIGDPAAQVQRNIRAVRECLRQHRPELSGRQPAWIEGLVVFPHPRTVLEAEHSRVPAVRLDEVAARIVGNVPHRWLQPADVDAIVRALLDEAQAPEMRMLPSAQTAQATVELALALPVVLALLFGTVALSRVIQAQTAIVAIVHEVARAGALGNTPDEAAQRMRARVELVAPGFAVDPHAIVLDWDVSAFDDDPGRVTAAVHYQVSVSDLPLVSWLPPMTLRAEHVEFVDPFRAGVQTSRRGGP